MSAILTSDSTSSYEDCIANNIPSRAFRYTAENKNVLSTKGAIYVGTGETRTNTMILADSSNEAVENISYITGVLLPPTNIGMYTLKCKVENINGTNVVTFGWVQDGQSSFASTSKKVGE